MTYCTIHRRKFSEGETCARCDLVNKFKPVVHVVTGTEARICADISKRQELGINKYGTTVAQNPLDLRQWLQHQYEELLDAAVYCKRAIEEIDCNRAAT